MQTSDNCKNILEVSIIGKEKVKDYVNGLVLKAKNGDEEAIRLLIDQYKPFIMKDSSKYRIIGFDFEDLVQHSYLSLIKAVHKYNFNKSSFTTYVMTSISNNLKYLLRSSIKHHREVPEENANYAHLPEYTFTIEDEVIAYEEVKKLQEVIDKLDEKERKLINNYYMNRVPMDQLAAEEGISYSGMRKRKDKLLRKMEKMMNGIW